MVHFSCDLCGRDLAADDQRYVVKIAAYAGHDADRVTEDDLDDDHMEAVSELLQRGESLSAEELDAQSYKEIRFDLCPTCHAKYMKDPLGRDLLRSLDFSQN